MKALSTLLVLALALSSNGQVLNPDVDSIPMRDGKRLAADIHRPNSVDTFPTVLVMTPYNRQAFRLIGLPLVDFDIDSSDYAFVIVDWRCFYGSQDACGGSATNGEDGYDVIDWIKNQSWSDGKIGTWGPSALGRIQYMTLQEQHPNHTCAVPLVASSQYSYAEYFPGGVIKEGHVETLDVLGFGSSPILYSNPVYNLLWQFSEASTFYPDEITKPCLMIGGWYDHAIDVMIDLFQGLQAQSPVATDHRLLFGPWVHGGVGPAHVGTSMAGELDYPNAAGWSDSLALMFFDYWLRGVTNGWDNTQAVQYYQLGDNTWQQSSAWPPAGIVEDTLHLTNGGLTTNADANSDSMSYDYDPFDPSPTVGGATLHSTLDQGPYDQVPLVEARNDILVFKTEPLPQSVSIRGSIGVHLFVSSNRKDTDFMVRLIDHYPDGRSMILMDNAFRMRFRNGFTAADTAVMVPGTVYEIDIPLVELAHTWAAGHSIQVDISSSNWPQYNRNMNDGGPMYTEGDTLIATNNVYFGGATGSYLRMPVTSEIILGKEIIEPSVTNVRMAPNPAHDHVSILGATTGSIIVFDMLGSKRLELKSLDATSPIDISALAPGSYLLEWRHEDTVEYLRFNKF